MPYENGLKIMNLPSVLDHRYAGDTIEVYKYLQRVHSAPSDSLLRKALPSTLREHD